MNNIIQLRKKLIVSPKVQKIIDECSEDGIIENWEWEELKKLCKAEKINPDRVRRSLELDGVIFHLPVAVNISIESNVVHLSILPLVTIQNLTVWYFPTSGSTISEANHMTNIRAKQPLPPILHPLNVHTPPRSINLLFKVEFANHTVWLRNNEGLSVLPNEESGELERAEQPSFNLVCVDSSSAENILRQRIQTTKEIQGATNSDNLTLEDAQESLSEENNTEAPIEEHTQTETSPPKKKTTPNTVTWSIIGLICILTIGYFGYSFTMSKKVESAAEKYLLHLPSRDNLSTLSTALDDVSVLYATDSIRNLQQLETIIQDNDSGLSSHEIVESTMENTTNSPIGQYTLGYAYNLGCKDGHLKYCNEALDIFSELVKTQTSKWKTAATLQYIDTLGFSTRITKSPQYTDDTIQTFCNSLDNTNITPDNLTSVIRCNAYKSDTLSTYDIAQWQSSMRQQINQMRRDNFDERSIMSLVWQSGSMQCLNTPLKESKNTLLPRLSWRKLPEVGYCYYVGLLNLDCPIKATQVREYGRILLPEKMWQAHFEETATVMSNTCQLRSRPRSKEEWELFSYTITNELSYSGYLYSIFIQPDGTFSTTIECGYYNKNYLSGFWSWDDYNRDKKKGELSLHVMQREGTKIYDFDKDRNFTLNIDVMATSKNLYVSNRTLTKIRKLSCQ